MAKVFKSGSAPAVLIITAEGKLAVLSGTCTVQIRRQLGGFGSGFRDAEEHLARAN